MPLKDEQVPELHGKMPNVTSETVEKTIVFGGFTAIRRFYCYYCYCWLLLLLATCYCAPKAAADNKLLPPTPTCGPHPAGVLVLLLQL